MRRSTSHGGPRRMVAARKRGLGSIEELIEQLVQKGQVRADDLRHRQAVVRCIDALRERLYATYGEMANGVELVRADRER